MGTINEAVVMSSHGARCSTLRLARFGLIDTGGFIPW